MSRSKIIVPTPEQLDAQSTHHIDEWLEIGSERFKQLVKDRYSLYYFLEVGFRSPPFFHVDTRGRIWGQGEASWFPFHDVIRGRTYGYKLSSKAPN
jgi:hypothetical protein